MSKNDTPLEQWVEKNCENDRSRFLKEHFIPNIDLSLGSFEEFYEARKNLLVQELIKILNS
ncbi:hypothetical protein [Helicobacter sp. UBA3407]|nr:hypothetical protein [Helicobacter sp. UBA3407]